MEGRVQSVQYQFGLVNKNLVKKIVLLIMYYSPICVSNFKNCSS